MGDYDDEPTVFSSDRASFHRLSTGGFSICVEHGRVPERGRARRNRLTQASIDEAGPGRLSSAAANDPIFRAVAAADRGDPVQIIAPDRGLPCSICHRP